MKTDLTARATAFCLSAFLTLAMLGGVDSLASSAPPQGLMARVAPQSPVASEPVATLTAATEVAAAVF